MQISILLKNILPPIFGLIRNVFRKSSFSDLDYQGIRLPFIMSRIHLGEFAKIHEKYTSLDSHINFNSNTTRLRVYYVVEFCRMALMNAKFYEIPKSRIENHEDNWGGVLTCGVSFGTSALITAELLESDLKQRKFYLLDAFVGVKSSSLKENTDNYNTDLNLVKSRWNTEIPAIWICDFLTIDSISNLPQLVFIQLNTGDYLSELRTLPILCSKLLKGGYLLMDLYGWQTLEKQLEIDKTLIELGLLSFQLVTRQLVIYKP